ncbi:protein of unknown function (plasmid) [Azospirillum lipoferum 4B]|uniref:Uncharacterized protein n=1 Tax=Azospirillum lipoferum (strain 4B) TaxID=862719 RepID=G7ZEH2_AZOL4|nr:protein of unknown function [Azospirillum lipoferum 4B]
MSVRHGFSARRRSALHNGLIYYFCKEGLNLSHRNMRRRPGVLWEISGAGPRSLQSARAPSAHSPLI